MNIVISFIIGNSLLGGRLLGLIYDLLVIMKFSRPRNDHFWMISGARNHLRLKISGPRMSAES